MLNNLLQLTDENYYSEEANKEYMSVSQFKDLVGTTAAPTCEYTAIQKINGQISEPSSTAMLIGSYVDSHFEGTLDNFKNDHPEVYKKTGDKGLKAEFVQAEDIIRCIEGDIMMNEYLSGQKQVIMTSYLFGYPWKIKMDSYIPGKMIVDLKIMKDMNPLWSPLLRQKTDFVHYYGYDIQGAVYQKVVEQVTGQKLPFFLAVATKERPADKAIIEITQDYLDEALNFVQENLEHAINLKTGLIPAEKCGVCSYCRLTKQLTETIPLKDLIPSRYNDNDTDTSHGPYMLFDD